jgi:hypothetical protein
MNNKRKMKKKKKKEAGRWAVRAQKLMCSPVSSKHPGSCKPSLSLNTQFSSHGPK